MLPRFLPLVPLVLLPAGMGLALSFVLPWFEDGYGRGLTFHVLAVVLAAGALSRGARERARVRDRDRRGIRVTALITEVDPLPTVGTEAEYAGCAVTLEFTDLNGEKQRKRDTSGLGGYAPEPGTQVIGRLMPEAPEDLEVLEIIGPKSRYPVTGPAHPWTPWMSVITLMLAVCFTAAVVLGPLYGLPASAAAFVPTMSVWMGIGFLWPAVLTCLSLMGLRGRATGEVTQARVHVRGSLNRHTFYSFTVRFSTPDGRQIHRHHTGEDTESRFPGTRLEVHYDPSHPPRFQMRTVNGDRHLMWISFVNATFFLGLGTAGAVLGF